MLVPLNKIPSAQPGEGLHFICLLTSAAVRGLYSETTQYIDLKKIQFVKDRSQLIKSIVHHRQRHGKPHKHDNKI